MARTTRQRSRAEIRRRAIEARRRREQPTAEAADEELTDEELTDEELTEREEAARERFSSPMISNLWHPDGTPFTDEEYRERGLEPPPPGEQPTLIIQE